MGRNLYIQKGAEEMTIYRIEKSGKTYFKDGLRKYLNRYMPRMNTIVFYNDKKGIKYRGVMMWYGYYIQRWDNRSDKWVNVNEF